MKLPYWLKGGILGVMYVLVLFLIKATCVPDWCFADLFLPLFWQPLTILDFVLDDEQIIFVGQNLFPTLLVFWFLIGSILGSLYKLFKPTKKIEEEEEKERSDLQF